MGVEDKVYRLRNALYGLRQAPRAWYSIIDFYFSKEGFKKCPYEHTLFTKVYNENKVLIVSLYVDDLVYTGNDASLIESFWRSMKGKFNVLDFGMMGYFLGVEVIRNNKGIFITQQNNAKEVLSRFGMVESKHANSYVVTGWKLSRDGEGNCVSSMVFKHIVGSLM